MKANPGHPEHDPFRLAPRVVILALAWLVLFPVTSVDAYYHLATGRRILEERGIPTRGVGSGTYGEAEWHDNEWGFQLLAASLGRAVLDPSGVWVLTRGGTVALIGLRALCLAATLALLSAQMSRMGVDALTRSAAAALAAFLTFGNLFWAVRPQIFTYLALAALGFLLELDRGGSRWARWACLAVIAVWANLHGAVVIGIGLIAVEAAGEWLEAFRRDPPASSRPRARRLAVVVLLAPLAACLNPHGIRQVAHPFLYLARPEIYRGNLEWTRPDLLHLPLLVLTFVVLVVALATGRRVRLAEVGRCGVFALLFLSAIRHLPLAVIVVVPVLAASLARTSQAPGWRRNLLPTGVGWGPPWQRALAAAGIVAAVVALSGAKFVGPWPRFGERTVRPMPEQAVRAIARAGDGWTVFNAYRFGGFLMFRLYPAEVAFMDGRNDLYGTFRDEVYNPILFTHPGWRAKWRDAVVRHDVGWVLLDAGDPLAGALNGDPEWRLATVDDGEIVLGARTGHVETP